MRFWRRPSSSPPPAAEDDRAAAPSAPEDQHAPIGVGWLTPDGMPAALQPKDDPAKERVYDDEIDPDWRDPGTAQ